MNNILISICIPAFNASKYIGETLASVKLQTFKDWELIVVEDATEDGTKEIVEEFGKHVEQNVVYIRNEETKGPAGTRNVASRVAKGKWIAYLDSDDLWQSNHLSELINTTLNYPNCDLIHSGVEVFDSLTGKIIFSQSITAETIAQFPITLFNRSYGFMPSQVLVSRNLFETTGGFNESVNFGIEDLEFWFKCAKANFKFALSEKKTCLYRQNKPESMTSNGLGMAIGCAQVYAIHLDWEVIPKSLRMKFASEAWLSAARIARKNNKSLAKECLAKSMKYYFNFKHLVYWLLFRVPSQ